MCIRDRRKPVLKEKQICSFGKAFLSKKRFLVKSRGFLPLMQVLWEAMPQNIMQKKTKMFFAEHGF